MHTTISTYDEILGQKHKLIYIILAENRSYRKVGNVVHYNYLFFTTLS